MIRVKLTTPFPKEPIRRQTPGRRGVWDNCQFLVNQAVEECDFWVVYEGLIEKERTHCPSENTIFITGEPPGTRKYRPRFLQQFGAVITCHRNLQHPRVIYTQQGLPWHIGRRVDNTAREYPYSLGYDELKSISDLRKDQLISVISSGQVDTEGHRRRLRFVQALREHFEDKLHVFGRGIRYVEDKWDAIANYKYHIVLENGSYRDYWTEKLSDAYLGGAYPLYYGCPNISDYFPKGSYTEIDVNDPDRSISIIDETISSQQYEKAVGQLTAAKDLVLEKYNLFAMLTEQSNNLSSNAPKTRVLLNPESSPSLKRRIAQKLHIPMLTISR